MRRFLSFILAIGVFFGAFTGFAAETTGLENAVSEVKSRIEIRDYEEFESEIRTENGQDVYLLNWAENTDDGYEFLGVAYSDGVILSYESSFKGKYSNERKFADVGRGEAEQIAKDFLRKINPGIYENIDIESAGETDLISNSHYFYLQRIHNGIPVLGENGSITVSKDNGQVRTFNLEYNTKINFENTDGIIEKDEGLTQYAKKLSPELCYGTYYDYENKELKVFPQYKSLDATLTIDAKTSEVYEILSKYSYPKNSLKQESITGNGAAADSIFSEAELAEFAKIDGLIDREEAERAAREKKNIGLEKRHILDGVSLQADYINSEQYFYNLRFLDKTEDKYDNVRVKLDAKDATVIEFYKSGDYSKNEQSIEKEKEVAHRALEEFTKNKFKNLEYKAEEKPGQIRYVRKENGIEVLGDEAVFMFDGEDNLVSYHLTYKDIPEFPEIDNVMAIEDAVKKVSEDIDFSLFYAVDYENKNAKPVYGFFENGMLCSFELNPFTAKRIDYEGSEITEDGMISYKDIDGHYAEDRFLKLAEYGIGFYGGELLPEKEITQSEYMMLLNELFGYDSDIDEIYARAYSKGVIKEQEREDFSPVTRENAAIFLIREMGAEGYAKYNEIYSEPFADVTENKGYIALLKAMGVVSGDDKGNYNPKNTITRGEALIIIYNYLNRVN